MSRRTICCLLLSITALIAAEGETVTRDFDWGRLSVPSTAAVGEQVTIVVALAPAQRELGGILRMDPHWWRGKDRAGVLGSVGTRTIVPAQERYTFTWTVPQREGLTSIQFVTYGGDGSWSGRRFDGGIGCKIR